MNWSASYRARAVAPPDTMDTTDKTPAVVGQAGVVSVVSAVSHPASGEGQDAPDRGGAGSVNSVRCITGKTKPIDGTALDLGKLPAGPCPACGDGSWWRVSAMEPHGPGPWRCRRCDRPDPGAWVDGHAAPTVRRDAQRPERT